MTSLRIWWLALQSGWKAGVKQMRKRRTELQRAEKMKTKPAAVL